jgi:hypothetical protein
MYQIITNQMTGHPTAIKKQIDATTVMSIPFDPANTDYQEYLKWVAEGGVPEPADQPE